jgi:hypothetical protein
MSMPRLNPRSIQVSFRRQGGNEPSAPTWDGHLRCKWEKLWEQSVPASESWTTHSTI